MANQDRDAYSPVRLTMLFKWDHVYTGTELIIHLKTKQRCMFKTTSRFEPIQSRSSRYESSGHESHLVAIFRGAG